MFAITNVLRTHVIPHVSFSEFIIFCCKKWQMQLRKAKQKVEENLQQQNLEEQKPQQQELLQQNDKQDEVHITNSHPANS